MMSCRLSLSPPRLRSHATIGPLALLLLAAGCASGTNSGPSSSRTASSGAAGDSATYAAALENVERRYVIGPMAAREAGFRVDWQYPEAGRNLRLLVAQHDSVFALDERNYLTRIDRQRGHRLWRLPVADPVHEIQGINYVPELDRVYLASGGTLIVLDATNGSQVGRQNLSRIANTQPLQFGQFLIYGSRNGQLIWHSFEIAFQWKAYQISPVIDIPPKIYDNVVITIGNDGRVTAHDAASGTLHWDKRLISRVAAEPALGNDGVFIASTDQHVWAYDLRTGRSLWRYLSERPLTDPPAFINDRVYQQVPSLGLYCFEAFPIDRPGGVRVWTNEEIRGNVRGARGGALFVWEPDAGALLMVDATRGGVMTRLELPQVQRLLLADQQASEIFASSADGRVVRLLPIN